MRAAIPLLLALTGCAPAASHGGGIVSTNPCADAILVQLVSPDRIAAISQYSHDPAATSLPLAVARRFPAIGTTAEEVIARRPALVLASSFTPAASRAAYAKAGLRVVTLDSPTTVAASVAQVRTVAQAVGASARGEMLAREIERSLTDLPPTRSAVLYIAGDLANGSGTLLDELMRRAGLRNAAADYGLNYSGTLPIETLAAHPPDVVIATNEGRTAPLRRQILRHTPEATFDRRLVNCGGPSIPPALARLRAIRASL